MNTNNGWIKLYRQMTEWGWYKDTNTKVVFLHLLLMASYEEHEYKGHTIKPGQVIIGRKKLAKDLGLTEMQIRTSLVHLNLTNEITIKTTNKFSIVTIENWAKYQGGVDESNQQNNQQNNQQVTNKQPHSRNKEYKNKGRITNSFKNKTEELDHFYEVAKEWADE